MAGLNNGTPTDDRRKRGLDQAQAAALALQVHAAWIDQVSAQRTARMAEITRLEEEARQRLVMAGMRSDMERPTGIARRARMRLLNDAHPGNFAPVPFVQQMAEAWKHVLAADSEGSI